MITKIRRKFTEWYVKRGYTFTYNKFRPMEATYNCPWWVKPLLIFFSPSVYFKLVYGDFITGWRKLLNDQSN